MKNIALIKIKNNITWPILIFFYLITRLINYKIIPIFTDEAIYSYWAQVALHDPENRYISLSDGKQPLFIWVAVFFQKFISDPLIATRLVSTFAGFLSLIGIYFVAKEIFNRKIALFSSILYIIIPFTLLYDRMALYDSLLAMFGIFSVYFSIKLAKKPSLDLAFLNAFAIGLGLITKSSADFYVVYIPFSLIFFDFKKQFLIKRLSKWLFLALTSVVIAEIMYNSLRLSPLFYIIAQKNNSFILSFSELIRNPFQYFYPNVHSIFSWVNGYVGPLIIILFLFGVYSAIREKSFKVVYLLFLVALPLIFEGFFNKVLYPRFVLFYFPYFTIITAFAIEALYKKFPKQKSTIVIIILLALIFPIVKSILLITNPTKANIPDADANQYLNDWPAGYGISEVVTFLKYQSRDSTINVGTEGTFGLLPFALNIYFYPNNNIKFFPYWPVDPNNIPPEMISLAKTKKTYFVFYQTQIPISNPHLKFLKQYKQGIGNSYLRLYQVI